MERSGCSGRGSVNDQESGRRGSQAVSDLEYRNDDIQVIEVINVNIRTTKLQNDYLNTSVRHFTDIKVYIFEDPNDSS